MGIYSSLIKTGRALWEEGLVTSHGGNMSVRVGPEKIVITKTGTMLGFLKEKDFIEVPLNATKTEYPEASSELIVHQAVYESTDAIAVVHAHPPYTVALSLRCEAIVPKDVEGKLTYQVCPVADVRKPHASQELAEKVADLLKEHKVICVKGHGTFAKGKSLEEALFYTSAVEFSAKIITISKTT